MKKIYLLVSMAAFLLMGGITACDDGSLLHKDVYIPDPVEDSDEDDGYSPEPTTESVFRVQPGEGHRHQLIDGFGCSFGWMEAVYRNTRREEIMEELYGDAGLRFNIYRGEICPSSLSSDGSYSFCLDENFNLPADSHEVSQLGWADFNGIWAGKQKQFAQMWLVNYLSRRNYKDIYYFFSVWTPPNVWKTFGSDGDPNGHFNSEYSVEFARYLAAFAKGYKERFGINVYGISGWNEPDQAMGGWAGCGWGLEQMADFTHDYLRPELDRQGCEDTWIIYGECPWWANAVAWMRNTLAYKPEVANDKIVAAGHGYSTVASNILPMTEVEEKGVHVWQTETCDDKTRDETWNDAMKWAENYHGYLINARANAIVWWAGARHCTTTGENLLQLEQYDISHSYYRVDRYYSIGQFSRYIQRGSRRVDVQKVSTSANRIPNDLTASAYIKDDTYTIVLVNNSKTRSVEALLEMEDKEFDTMISYTSSASVKWLRKKLNPSLSGKRSVTVPKHSVVTITGRFRDKTPTVD